ncbi:MAG TPA: hypothetical protein VEF04_09180 [Blastocatellia bacterium]|nr:hypothetical protein [Blastocatellia bacterium]
MVNYSLSNRGIVKMVVTLPPLMPMVLADKKADAPARPTALLSALAAALKKRSAIADGNS